MSKTRKLLAALWADESGISSVEYALLLAFVGGGIVLAALELKDAVAEGTSAVGDCVELDDLISKKCQNL